MKPIYNQDLKKQLLGEMGSAIIQKLIFDKGMRCYPPWDVFHRSCDLVLIAQDKKFTVQIKCKVPWVVKGAQSFTPEQWEHYKQVDFLFFICAPVKGRFEERDVWKGNIYSGCPSRIETIEETTKGGRKMTLVPLTQSNLFLETKIDNEECLQLMSELTTQDD